MEETLKQNPTIGDQIDFVHRMRTAPLVILTAEHPEMLRAIENNLIAVRDYDGQFMILKKHRPQIIEVLNMLEESKEIIKQWHCMGMDEATTATTWLIYESNAPEMIRINNLIRKYRREVSNG